MSFANNKAAASNEMSKISKTDAELKDSGSTSKALEIIKQKKMSRMSLGESGVSKKLASDNIDYDPVFK